MREFICALHAIWDCWESGTPLNFRGDFYQHTLMGPFFSPPAIPWPRPRVMLAAVGEKMTQIAAEVADGIFLHAFTTERYIREATIPAIEAGLIAAGHPGRASSPDRHRPHRGGGGTSPPCGPSADCVLRQHSRL
jgi:alkanesulfonate monooxygenase SsuD/methylene tetrahydromethanopterin reductase-like flavin-dependent oxidoreductase (luciferase family)